MEFSRGKHPIYILSFPLSPCSSRRRPHTVPSDYTFTFWRFPETQGLTILSPQSSSLSSPTSSHRQALTPSPSPPSYAPLPETITSPRGRARNHTHPSANSPPPPHHPSTHSHSHYHGHRQQVTPPPTPPTFDARNASAKLRSIDGYVSFANVEGLGGPPGVDEDPSEEEKRRGSWWQWRGRERSGSLTAP
jgi:hypothetical protein